MMMTGRGFLKAGLGGWCAALILAFSVNLSAEPVAYAPDKWHTRVMFSVTHMGLSHYVGRFKEANIDFVFDEENVANSQIRVVIPVASIDTFHELLTSKMLQKEFFEADRYPTIEFVSTHIEQTGPDTGLMTGDLTMHGVTRPVTLDIVFNGKIMHPRFKLNNIGFTATGTLDRTEFGMNLGFPDMIGGAVTITIELEAFEGDTIPYYGKNTPVELSGHKSEEATD